MLTAAGLLGILLAPMSAPYVWTVLLGLGHNAAFPLALMLIVLRGGSVAITERLSTLAPVGGVCAGAAGGRRVAPTDALVDAGADSGGLAAAVRAGRGP